MATIDFGTGPNRYTGAIVPPKDPTLGGFTSPAQETAWHTVTPAGGFDTSQQKQDLWNQTFPANSAPSSGPATTNASSALDHSVNTAQQWQHWASYGDLFDFWDGWDGLDMASAVNVWNRTHPNDPAQVIGHSGDAVRYRGQDWDGITDVGSSNQRKVRLFKPSPSNGGGGDANGGGGANTSSTYGNSPNTELYVNEILSRLKQLHDPVNDPMRPALYKNALQRVQDLTTNAPYTQGQDAALVAHYRDPLTQARDANYQRNREIASARGLGKDSGLIDILDKGTNQTYERGIAQGSNDLAVQAVGEQKARHQEALSILASLVDEDKTRRAEETAQANSLLQTASLLPGMDERRLGLLLNASSDGNQAQSQSLATLLQLAQMNQNQTNTNTANSQADAQAWGQWLASVLQGMT